MAQEAIILKDTTKDKAEGTAHEVKGAVKEKSAMPPTIPTSKPREPEKAGGKFQKKVGEAEKS